VVLWGGLISEDIVKLSKKYFWVIEVKSSDSTLYIIPSKRLKVGMMI